MNAYRIRKSKTLEDGTVKEYTNTYIAMTESDAMEEAKEGPARCREGYTFETVGVTKRGGQSKLSDFQDRYGYKPAYGDYEATGHWDK